MTKDNKKTFMYFITRTGMFIDPVDDKNIVSFIHGYELGTKIKCDFRLLTKQLLAGKYKIEYNSGGWHGQIKRLSEQLSMSWIMTFKKIALEVMANEEKNELNIEIKEIFKSRVVSLIERINASGDPFFNEYWKEEWQSLCLSQGNWFKQIWTESEWAVIKSINKEIQTNNIFEDKQSNIPTSQLIKLRDKYLNTKEDSI